MYVLSAIFMHEAFKEDNFYFQENGAYVNISIVSLKSQYRHHSNKIFFNVHTKISSNLDINLKESREN